MLGADYDSSADMWSFACMMFEMVTGEFLFEPRKGKGFMKTDEHLAQMMELLGPAPQTTVMRGTKYKGFFNRKGQFRRIRGLAYLPLKTVMLEKYRFKELEAHNFADFLLLMLTWEPEKRASAQEMLNHPWLRMADDYDFKVDNEELTARVTERREAGFENNKEEVADAVVSDD